MSRRIAAPFLALLVVLGIVAGAQSDPGTGVTVPTLAEHNELEARVSELEDRATAGDHEDSAQNNRLDALEEWVASAPRPTPTEGPTPDPTPTPEPDPTEEPTPEPEPGTFPTEGSVGPDVEPTDVYAGDCEITANDVVIEGKVINCHDTGLVVAQDSHGLVIRDSVVNGGVFTAFSNGSYDGTVPDPRADDDNHPRVFTIESSRVYSGTGNNNRALSIAHYKVTDSLIEGSHSGLWAHNKVVLEGNVIRTDGTSTHQSGLRMLKNSVLRGNTITCTPSSPGSDGGCSGHAVFYPEWGVPKNLTIEGNYFKRHPDGGPWFGVRFINCHQRNDCVGISFTGNTFDRGNGTDGGEFPDDTGDVWEGNYWADGEPAAPQGR